MFTTDSQGVTVVRPNLARMERMTEVVRYASDVPCIPPAFIAAPVTLPAPPWAAPINE